MVRSRGDAVLVRRRGLPRIGSAVGGAAHEERDRDAILSFQTRKDYIYYSILKEVRRASDFIAFNLEQANSLPSV